MIMVTPLIAALLLALGSEAPLQQPSPCQPSLEDILSNVKTTSAGINDLRAEFVQEKVMTVLGEKEKSVGQIFYKRPDLLVIRHDKPEKVTMWFRGCEVLIYEEHIDQLRKHLMSEEDRDLSFLAARFDRKALEKRFSLALKKAFMEKDEELFLVELTPKSEELKADIDNVEVVISRRTWLVRRISIHETNRDVTHITFGEVWLNTGLSGGKAIPKVPEGKPNIDLSE